MPINSSYQKTDSLSLIDAVYRIENEELIPIRHTEVAPKKGMSYNPSPLKTGAESWQVIILMIAVLVLGMTKSFSNNRYRLGLKALFSYKVAQGITREEQVFFHRSNLLLTGAYTLTLSLFVYQIKRLMLNENSEPEGFNSFLVLLLGIVIVYLVKYIFSKVILFIFNDTNTASEYIFNVSLYNNLLGALLIPVLCVNYFTPFPFQPFLLYVVVPLAFIVFLLRLIRLFIIGRSTGVLYVYIFLYICSLEILPLVVLYRIFVR